MVYATIKGQLNLVTILFKEDIYDVVPDMKEVQKTDAVTGKEKHHPRARMPLFLPGRIIHISWGPKQSR